MQLEIGKQIAVARLHLRDGRILKRAVVKRTPDGYEFHELCGEEPFTEWYDIDFYLDC